MDLFSAGPGGLAFGSFTAGSASIFLEFIGAIVEQGFIACN
jgi:hypothetical protein